ncbi:MAG TPA: zf-HC2 domain-containing protein [Pyrinomonadaceae bacterium]|nr:zf-HC2 domain-containing protein [Pyrinomonadaceae bacterium]
MTCEETQRAFSLYLDGELARTSGDAMDEHLDVCPVCRFELEKERTLVRSLGRVERPVAPAGLAASITEALAIERAAQKARPFVPLRLRVARWLEPHLMPYTVGAFYSLLLFAGVFAALRGQLTALRNLAEAARLDADYSVTMLAAPEEYDVTRPLSAKLYAAKRMDYSAQSPSLNPSGALAALAWSPPSNGRPEDDDMIVVADVYGNGSASLAAVVEPPRNPRMLDELQAALRKNPAFVPASLDRRPQTMRVVFVLQKMNVQDASY